LVAAEKWGCPPWEIAGGNKLVWWFRWVEGQRLVNEKLKLDNQHG
jgi:hypothetical protein